MYYSYKHFFNIVMVSFVVAIAPLFAHAYLFNVDNTEVGLRTFTFEATDYNISPSTAESSCRLVLNKVDKGLMFETGTNTGIFAIKVEMAKGVYPVKVLCKTDALGEDEIGYGSLEFGAEMVSTGVPEKKLHVNDIWYLGAGYAIKIASINSNTNPKQVEIWQSAEEYYKKVVNVGDKYYFRPGGNPSDEYSFRVAGVSTDANGKNIVSITDSVILKSKIDPDNPPGMTAIFTFNSYAKKTLMPGESWDLNGWYALVVKSIDAKSKPRRVTLNIVKNCQVIDKKTITEKEYYNLPNILKLYAESIFSGATADMVQFKKAFISRDYDVVSESNNVENWSCGAWSACHNNGRTRTCTELNSCGTTIEKPATHQYCTADEEVTFPENQEPPAQPSGVSNCIERWGCKAWSRCINNLQTRECNDYNKCGTEYKTPATQQSCTISNENSTTSGERGAQYTNRVDSSADTIPDTSMQTKNTQIDVGIKTQRAGIENEPSRQQQSTESHSNKSEMNTYVYIIFGIIILAIVAKALL